MVVVLGWITLILIFIVLGLVALVAVIAVLGHTHPVIVLYGSLIGYMCRHWAICFVDGVDRLRPWGVKKPDQTGLSKTIYEPDLT